MIRENRKTTIVNLAGGMELEENPLQIRPGALIGCKNFRCKSGGGYERIDGYEAFDGHPSPSEAEDPDTARAVIAEVPGEGDILGVWLFNGVVYAFRNHTGGASAKMFKSTASGWSEVTTGVTLNPDGQYEFVNYNFYASSASVKMFGCDGANKAFMFDGTAFTQITVYGTSDFPKHVAAHKNHLFLSYEKGQWVHSGLGDPTKWNPSTEGAGAGGIGDDIVSMVPTIGGALAFFGRNKINILYGASQSDWQANDVRIQSDQAGAHEWTVQSLGGDVIYLDDRGLTTMQQTEQYGNFTATAIDRSVRRYVQANKDTIVGSTISRDHDEYRLYFDITGGTEVLTATFGRRFGGFARTVYPFHINCLCSLEDTDGTERVFAGASDGFIYELDKGDSFNGDNIESYIKTAFFDLGSPAHKKRWRYARFSLDAPASVTLLVKPDFNYGAGNKTGHPAVEDTADGSGGVWGDAVWGEFTWGAAVYDEAAIDISGTAINMSLLITNNSDNTPSFIVHDAIITYSPRGFTR